MLINENQRRRSPLARAAITIGLLLPAIRLVTGPASPGSFAGAATASGEGAQAAGATNNAPTVAGKTAPAMKTPGREPDLQGMWSRGVDITLQRPIRYCDREL